MKGTPSESIFQLLLQFLRLNFILLMCCKHPIIIISVPPHIEDARRIFTVIQGDAATLLCQAKGVPAPNIIWYRDGHRIAANDPRFKVLESGSLQFGGVQVRLWLLWSSLWTDKTGICLVIIWPGVVDNTHAFHAGGPGFDSRWRQLLTSLWRHE